MLKVKVLTIGRSKEPWLKAALAEYEKRLKGTVKLEWHLAKNDSELTEWAIEEPYLILFDPAGDLFTSEQFSQKLIRLFEKKGARLTFVIGGAEGIPSKIRNQPHQIWSLSRLTFTHQMTRLILIEQLYRALEIQRSSAYHKSRLIE